MNSEPAALRAIEEEQKFANRAYAALDEQNAYYSGLLKDIRAQGAQGTPAARSERDSFATHYEDNLLRLRNVENRLILGRLDFDTNADTAGAGASNEQPEAAGAPTEAGADADNAHLQHEQSQHEHPFIHIGRITLRDHHHNILLTDWRAPQSQPFYQATAVHRGNVQRRRHIQTRFRTVTSVEDELLTSEHVSHISDLNLTGEGALMAAMSRAREGKMGDIVATIQGEQDRIIRAPSKGILVVQGGPGTGKTAVALHRAAYLLYAERERLNNSGVLLIGPSHRFLHYIDQVLPSLGESTVVATTIDELLPGVVPSLHEDEETSAIKSRIIWRTIARRAVPSILEKPLKKPVHFRINGKRITLTPDHVAEAQRRARQSGKPHNQARNAYARYLVDVLSRQLAAALDLDINSADWIITDIAEDPDIRREVNLHWLPASPQWLLDHILKWPELLKRIAPELSAHERSRLQRSPGHGYSRADIPLLDELAEHLGAFATDAQLHKQAARAREDQQLNAYVAQTFQTMGLGSGIVTADTLTTRIHDQEPHLSMAERAAAERTWTYGHVIVDEAQELTPMQWAMIARRNPSRSMTIVGDVDQRIHIQPGTSWADILGGLATYMREEELTISYRTPREILDRAAQAMKSYGMNVRPVRAARSESGAYRGISTDHSRFQQHFAHALEELWDFLNSEYGKNLGTLAVITPESDSESLGIHVRSIWERYQARIASENGHAREAHTDEQSREAHAGEHSRETAGVEHSRLCVLNAEMAKGLEYDAVIVVEPDEIAQESLGNLYVALTRATKRLTVISTHKLPTSLQ